MYLNEIGYSNTEVFYARNDRSPSNLYLKISLLSKEENLERESHVLNWLKSKAPVPEVVEFELRDGVEYLLLTEIEGVHSYELLPGENAGERIALVGRSLRCLHEIEIATCPFSAVLSIQLRKAIERVEKGRIDVGQYEQEHDGRQPGEILSWCLENQPVEGDLVFSHGDYCYPNILVKGEQLSGFIDFSRAGKADRYQDLALGYRSTRYNFGGEKEAGLVFLKSYGVGEIDWERIKYYIALDTLL